METCHLQLKLAFERSDSLILVMGPSEKGLSKFISLMLVLEVLDLPFISRFKNEDLFYSKMNDKLSIIIHT